MVVYNLYLVLNDEPIEIYDKHIRIARYTGSSNNIPAELMDRLVHFVTVLEDEEKRYKRLIVVID